MGTRRWTTKATRESVYAAARYLGAETEREAGVQIPIEVYSQDPLVAKESPEIGFEELFVRWEPGISDGPTSARFAVVDFDGDTEKLAPKAEWHCNYRKKQECFLRAPLAGEPEPKNSKERDADFETRRLARDKNTDSLQFHQVNVWAVLQNALAFFEGGAGLGRPIPFGFEGNRLIVVPHAGYGKNAFYDRASKSLQFYYFDDDDGERVYTCLSADIINHEFGHAVLDGVRPHLSESTLVETAAFHEFIGDFSAILLLLRNNSFRGRLVESTEGDLNRADHLANIAEQFGKGASNKPYLRTARSPMTMGAIKPYHGPHKVSEVMTAAMFDILLALGQHYREREEERRLAKIAALKARTDPTADEEDQIRKLEEKDAASVSKNPFWWAIQAMQGIAIQPLDLLPPVDVTFRDYALAVLRADELANPLDPNNHRERMRSAFVNRGILTGDEEQPKSLFVPLDLTVFHDVGRISSSRTAAYAFLDDNRDDLLIPADQDIVVADLYDAQKHNRDSRQLPSQVVLTYIWREDVELVGERFGDYQGQRTSLVCGGTLVLDQNGAVVAWTRKPGTKGGEGTDWAAEIEEGKFRHKQLLDNLAARIKAGQVGAALGSGRGLLGSRIPPLTVKKDGGELHFALSPHMRLDSEDQDHYTGGRRWEPSS